MPRTKQTSVKKTTTTRKKTTRRKTAAKKTTDQSIVTSMDKEQLVSGLKQTMKDVGKLPWMFLAPVIAYVSSKYESIPEWRRKKLEEIVQSSKEQGWSTLSSIKDRFLWRFDDLKETITSDTDKKPVKKKTTTRKRTPRKTTKKSPSTTTKAKTSSTNKQKAPARKTTTRRKKTPTTKKTTD